jgi:hypothetical protein
MVPGTVFWKRARAVSEGAHRRRQYRHEHGAGWYCTYLDLDGRVRYLLLLRTRDRFPPSALSRNRAIRMFDALMAEQAKELDIPRKRGGARWLRSEP